ncbi:MAG: acyltransferase family protein [Steroidobacteraceae bacterium]
MQSALRPRRTPRHATQGDRVRLLRGDIEGLRALAVLAVIAYHVAPHGLSGGFAGVDIFFVISGYLIGRHLLEDIQAGQLSFRGFYTRRARRILPALIVVLVAVWGAGWWILSGPELEGLGRHVLAAVVFSNNFLLWSESGYFDAPSLSKPLLHLWSLGIEEQFYLLIPVLLWLGSRGRSASARWVVWLSVASLIWTVLRPEPSFYLLDTRFWELGAGVLLANLALMAAPPLPLAGALRRHDRQLREAVACAGIVCIGVTLFEMSSLGWPGPQTVVPVLGTALLIASGPTALVNRVLGWRPLVFIGGISYPLYLWHWPAIVYWRMVHVNASPASCLVPVTAAVLLAYLTKCLIEDPVRFGRVGDRQVGRPPVWGLAVGLLAAAVLGISALANGGYPNRFPPGVSAIASWSIPDEDAPWRANRCYLYPGDNRAYAPECTPPRRAGVPRVVLWGDSHAADLYPGLKGLQQRTDFSLVQWTAAGCAPTRSPLGRGEFPSCAVHRAAVLAEMPQLAPDTVILAGAWELYLQDGIAADTILAAVQDDIRWLRSIGVRHVVLFGPGPTWHVSLSKDLFRYMMLHRTSRIPARLGGPSTAVRRLDAAMAARAAANGATYVSILQQLCDSQGCRTLVSPQRNAQTRPDLVFRDRDHLTPSGSHLLIDTVSRDIFPNLSPAAYALSAR